ncbi:hypothetical protein D9M68_872220 [compost metagenome]
MTSSSTPGNVLGMTTVSNYPERTISAETYNAARAALSADPVYGHRLAYLILYQATGNPAFSSNLSASVTSGDHCKPLHMAGRSCEAA